METRASYEVVLRAIVPCKLVVFGGEEALATSFHLFCLTKKARKTSHPFSDDSLRGSNSDFLCFELTPTGSFYCPVSRYNDSHRTFCDN